MGVTAATVAFGLMVPVAANAEDLTSEQSPGAEATYQGVDFQVSSLSGNSAQVSLENGSFRLDADSLVIADENGNVVEQIPVSFEYQDGTVIGVDVELVSPTVAQFSGELEKQGSGDPDTSTVHPMKWEGSWDECVSEHGVSGALAGALTGAAAGGAGAIPGAVLGMLSTGAIAALTSCRGLPFA